MEVKLAKTAIKPDFFSNFPSIKKEVEAQKKGTTEEERNYYSMSLTIGWTQFKSEAERLINELDQLNDTAVANGSSYEELGKNAVVVSLAKGIIKRLLDKVSDSQEACEREQPTGDE